MKKDHYCPRQSLFDGIQMVMKTLHFYELLQTPYDLLGVGKDIIGKKSVTK